MHKLKTGVKLLAHSKQVLYRQRAARQQRRPVINERLIWPIESYTENICSRFYLQDFQLQAQLS